MAKDKLRVLSNRTNKSIRVIGFDDCPFDHESGSLVNLAGIVCANTRFEGMLWGSLEKDGLDSTETIIEMVSQSKFYQQLHAILFDGVAFGGFNIIDLKRLNQALKLPCISVMRKPPNFRAIREALKNFEDGENRWQLIQTAGEIFALDDDNGHAIMWFQVHGCEVQAARHMLRKTTDTGKVPEALRLAHLIGAAVKTGQSNNRA